MSPSQITMLAATIAIALSQGKTECEVKALINLINLVQNILVGILAQNDICDENISEFIF